MCLGNKTKKSEISFDGKIFENSKEKTFLGVTKDNKLTFYNHIKGFWKKNDHKMLALQEFHFTYDISYKLLRPTQFLKNFLETLKWSTLYQASPPPTPYFSTNTKAFAKKLPQLLTIKTDNRGSRIGLKFYVSYCIIKKKFGFQVYNKVPN